MRDIERKRAYDRERMARLHAEGKTWWQRQEDLRPYYDQARSLNNYLVALTERIVGQRELYRELSGVEPEASGIDLAKAKEERRAQSPERFARTLAALVWLPCHHCGKHVVAGYKEHNPTFAVHARCLREVYRRRQAERQQVAS